MTIIDIDTIDILSVAWGALAFAIINKDALFYLSARPPDRIL